MPRRDAAGRSLPIPSAEYLIRARQFFEANEPRGLFYRAATELVALSLDGKTNLSVAEAVAVLLQTWNSSYHRYRRFDRAHFADVEAVLAKHTGTLRGLRNDRIGMVAESGLDFVAEVGGDFERVLGPVGAAKCLHLLAPSLFPLHEAIQEVLRRNGCRPMWVEDIAAEINRLRLYNRDDREPVLRNQVVARMTHHRYRRQFERTSPGHYRLRCD